MNKFISIALFSSVLFAQQPADFEASIDGLGLEMSCLGTPSWPTFLNSISSPVSFDFDVTSGANSDYFELYAVWLQSCNFFGFSPTQYGIIDLDLSSPGFSQIYTGFTSLYNGAYWGSNFSVPLSLLQVGDVFTLQAIVIDATHPAGARLTNAMTLFN